MTGTGYIDWSLNRLRWMKFLMKQTRKVISCYFELALPIPCFT